MANHTENRNLWLSTGIILVLTIVVWLAEKKGSLTSTRLALHNALNPGRLAVLAISTQDAFPGRTTPNLTRSEITELQNALLENELQRRRLLIENARLHNELNKAKQLDSVRAISGHDLLDFVTVKASVLNHNGLSGAFRESIIDAGRSLQLQPSQLVVDGKGLLIDKGTDHKLSPGQKVAYGTAVVGRIREVSEWVGLVQPVTSVEFSAAVQIVKPETQGASFGAKGLLKGMGTDRCQITGIAYTEAVAVGDEVFSADINGVAGPRLYFGRVTKASFMAGGQWDIEVSPAFDPASLTEVAVICPEISAPRMQHSRQSSGTRQ